MRKPTQILLKKSAQALSVAGAIFFVVAAQAAETPRAAVEKLNVGIRQSDKSEALLKAIREVFDLNRVAASSVGRYRFKSWDKKQQKIYNDVFTEYMIAVYLNRFKNYQGNGLKIYKVEQQKNRARVRATIEPQVDEQTLNRRDPVKIDFQLFASDEKGRANWMIVDVYFKGTISEVAGFRGQFAKIVQDGGWDGLIREMKAKKKALASKK